MDTTPTRRGSTPLWLVLGVVGACSSESPGRGEDQGAQVSVNIAALGLANVGDVVWDLEVVNGKTPTPDVVWRQRITSSRYGDGRGSATYVGPCDAGSGVAQNTVKLWVVGLYAGPVTSPGAFASGSAAGVVGSSLPFQNPTLTQPLTQTVPCAPNADTPVAFDVTLMRPAEQGFFDIAVNFNDIFCSAKFDCCVENASGACASDLELLHDASGQRATTFVLGFACTAGPGTDVETELYLDALELDCSPGGPFVADLAVNPTAGPGNLCAVAGDPSTCNGIIGTNLGQYIYQAASYRGVEALTSNGVAANKVYWNLALGVNKPAIAGCRLRTRGTAVDGQARGDGPVGVVGPGKVYPFIHWDVNLGTCGAEPLTFGDPNAMVRTAYSGATSQGTSFGHAYGQSLAPAPLCAPGCGNGVCVGGSDGAPLNCLCGPGRRADPLLGCVDVGPCLGDECGSGVVALSGSSAAAGRMISEGYLLDFQLAPASLSVQAADGTLRLNAFITTRPAQ